MDPSIHPSIHPSILAPPHPRRSDAIRRGALAVAGEVAGVSVVGLVERGGQGERGGRGERGERGEQGEQGGQGGQGGQGEAAETRPEQPRRRLIDLITEKQLGRRRRDEEGSSGGGGGDDDGSGEHKKVSGLAARLMRRIPPPPEWGREIGGGAGRSFLDLDRGLEAPASATAMESVWRDKEGDRRRHTGGGGNIFTFDAALRAARERPKARTWAGE